MKKPQSKKQHSFQLAIALKHEMGDSAAPRVISKGQGLAARKILEIAEENEVPIHQDAALSQVLNQVEVEDTIPPDLYEAVAQILAFIYRADKQAMESLKQ